MVGGWWEVKSFRWKKVVGNRSLPVGGQKFGKGEEAVERTSKEEHEGRVGSERRKEKVKVKVPSDISVTLCS